ncbi:DNA polymerase III subunit gamma/tau [Microbacterium sulfonylureivorans]|uniref:DNA polymerase III subunit gamma/tau n=1 Tax=Microbacterium sulfonylureivorans TaxID=2486854 RepID=UPI000FD8DCD4|nr:DNA polymerase III subunit gamma/tau [Microbacterium sulfonylureivorans]
MPAGRDDDALTWDGDDDPTLDVGAAETTEAVNQTGAAAPLPEGWSAVGKGSKTLDSPEGEDVEAPVDPRGSLESDAQGPAPREPMGNVELISLGVLGGFSVLYAVGWLIGGLRLQDAAQFLVASVAYQVSLWLAILAPIVWFGSVYLLTTGSKKWVRFLWLIGGVLFLIPWPFIMVGAIGR